MPENELLWPTASRLCLEAHEGRIRTKASRDAYDKVLRQLQKRHPGKPVGEFVEDDLALFCNEKYAPLTLLQRRAVVEFFFSWAVSQGMTQANIAASLKQSVRISAKPQRQGNWLTEDKVRQLLAACDDGTDIGQRDRILLMTALFTGLRRAELAALRWGAIDLAAGELFVFGKGEKPAMVGLSPEVVEALFTWRGECAKGLGRPPAAGDAVFPRARSFSLQPGSGRFQTVIEWDQPVGHNAIACAVRKRGRLMGVQMLAPHDLRRTFIGLAHEQATDILELCKMARHSNVGTTQRYIEDNPRKGVEAGKRFTIAS